MNKRLSSFSLLSLLAAGSIFIPSATNAQVISKALPSQLLPNSPGVASTESAVVTEDTVLAAGTSQSSNEEKAAQKDTQAVPPSKVKRSRVSRIFPNYSSFSSEIVLPPQTPRDKFNNATRESFDFSSLFVVAASASYSYGLDYTPEFGRGGVAYGRYLWHAAADRTIENYFVKFIVPAVAREDTRFYILEKGSFGRRARYSLGRVFVTRSDSGREVFNASEIFGAAAAAGVSSLYYPRPERTFGNFAISYGTNIGIDAASFFVKEFYPQISGAFSRHKQQVPAP